MSSHLPRLPNTWRKIIQTPPNLDDLRVFGCVGYVHQNKGKLRAKAAKCMFVGFTEGVKGYKMWHPIEMKFIIKRDVTFKEKEMFMQKEEKKEEST